MNITESEVFARLVRAGGDPIMRIAGPDMRSVTMHISEEAPLLTIVANTVVPMAPDPTKYCAFCDTVTGNLFTLRRYMQWPTENTDAMLAAAVRFSDRQSHGYFDSQGTPNITCIERLARALSKQTEQEQEQEHVLAKIAALQNRVGLHLRISTFHFVASVKPSAEHVGVLTSVEADSGKHLLHQFRRTIHERAVELLSPQPQPYDELALRRDRRVGPAETK